MKRIVNGFLHKFNLQLVRINDHYSKKLSLYKELFQINSKEINNSIGCIVFSMDRALQLDALIRSLVFNKIGECKVAVIFKASNDGHKNAYHDVMNRYNDQVVFIEESSTFKATLLEALDGLNTGKLFFLVDDIIFTEQVNFDILSTIDTGKFIFSLRMGSHLNFSYVVDKPQELPDFIEKNDEFLYWDWEGGELDWAYPLSVDGHIFGTEEIKLLAQHFDFKTPNSFESVLQKEKELFSKRLGMSYPKARIVNNPCNKVQNEVKNLHGSTHQDTLLAAWNCGKEIYIEMLQGYVNKSVHEEIEFEFKDRKNG